MTDKVFQQHCYVVPQHDAHWPYLTCRETLEAAAQLYQAPPSEVNAILHKMGLDICADVRNASLSGGQRRRLSIGLALLKQPTILYLGTSWCTVRLVLVNIGTFFLPTLFAYFLARSTTDEPTSGTSGTVSCVCIAFFNIDFC